MLSLTRLWRRLRAIRSLDRIDAELDAEMQSHIDMETERHIRDGMGADAARAQALRDFGGVARHRDEARDAHGIRPIEELGRDVRFAVRTLLARPGFSTLLVLTLSLGIGVNAALFSFLDPLFFRPPGGVVEPEQLVRLYYRVPPSRREPAYTVTPFLSYPAYRDIGGALPAGAAVAPYWKRAAQVGRGEFPDSVQAVWAGPGFFSVIGVGTPAVGHYPPDEQLRAETPTGVAVVSHSVWERRFGSSSDIVGTRIELNRRHYTIVAVAPRGFSGIEPEATDFWLSLGDVTTSRDWFNSRNSHAVRLVARASTITPDQLTAIAGAAFRQGATFRDSTHRVVGGPVLEAMGPMAHSSEIKIATRLAGVSLVVLLIAWANAANLLLNRALQRRREIAVRLALGVSRARLAMSLVTESLVLSVAAGFGALAFAYWGGAALRLWLLPDTAWAQGTVDGRVALFAFVLSVATALLIGVPTALRADRGGLTHTLRSGPRAGYQTSRLRNGLVVAQTALSILLLVAAGAFVRSLRTAEAIRTGYETSRMVLVDLRFDDGAYHRNERAALLETLRGALASVPGVEYAALSGRAPMSGYSMPTLQRADGSEIPGVGELRAPSELAVTPDFFRATGVRLIAGRDFNADDRAGSPLVMIVNRAMAQAIWPDSNALGKCLRERPRDICMTVVGIVENSHRDGLIEEGDAPMYFKPTAQSDGEFGAARSGIVRIASTADIDDVMEAVVARARVVLPPRVYATATPMRDILRVELRQWILGATLFTAFGVLALVVAAIGTYSTMSYMVGERSHELGVRIALGARAAGVLRLVVSEGLRLALIGVVLGVALAVASGRAIGSLLYQTSPSDPVILAVVSAVLTVAAVMACIGPAWRATRVDPIRVLRAD
jgi:putative ABC transport system permease protein